MSTLFLLLFACVAGQTTPDTKATPADAIISEAISGMIAKRGTLTDPIEKSKIDKAIRELELLLEEPPPSDGVEINSETLKKKFTGRASYDSKSGLLTIKYDFQGKNQLADFDVGEKRVLVVKKMLAVEAGDTLKHNAKFTRFTVSAIMSFKAMNGIGIGSTAGTNLGTGGLHRDTIYLAAAGGGTASKIVPDNFRRGNVPITLDIAPQKISLRYAREVLTVPAARNDVHQLLLNGGPDGCGFSEMVISGIPEPTWFKELLAAP